MKKSPVRKPRPLFLGIVVLVIIVPIAIVLFKKLDSLKYKDPGYLDYKKGVEYCGQFFGGGTVQDSPELYNKWKRKEPIPC